MDNLYLREFIDLAGTCNFQESAENMHISASSLSKHIAKLESSLKVSLFDRSTRTVTLSEYGQILLTYATQIVGLEDQCLSELQNALTVERSVLRIGFLPLLGHFGILDIVAAFRKEHPDIRCQVTEGNQLTERLLDRKFDFIFVDAFAPRDNRISRVLVMQDHLVAVFPEDHPLAASESVSIRDLNGEKILLQTKSTEELTMTSNHFISLCKQQDFEPNVVFKSRYISTLGKMVEQDAGVAILNSSEIRGVSEYRYSVVDIEPRIPFDLYIDYMPQRIRTDSAKLFLRYLKNWARQHGGIL